MAQPMAQLMVLLLASSLAFIPGPGGLICRSGSGLGQRACTRGQARRSRRRQHLAHRSGTISFAGRTHGSGDLPQLA
jgi:hypothetical protein